MSWPALGWASKQRPGRVADKMVLIALADRHSEESDIAYPSVAWLAEFACLDRKTVVASLGRLEAAGLIEDSGQRVGKTKQIKAYRLLLNDTEKGDPKPELLAANDTTFSAKQSQKRDTEPSLEPSNGFSNEKPIKRASVPRPAEVSEGTWRDYTKQRKKPVTDTALRGLKREADKAGWTLEAALIEATERGWEAFKADWVKGNGGTIRQGNGSGADKRSGLARAIDRELERVSALP